MKEKLFALQPQLQKSTEENLATLEQLQKKTDEAEEMKK